MPPPPSPIVLADGSSIYFQGPDLQLGTKPAVIYFALSAQMSLYEDPFNRPVLRLSQRGVRVFSWDLPFHGPGLDPHDAIRQWAEEFVHRPSFVSDFVELCGRNIDFLIRQGWVDPDRLGIAGLSRGGFIASHLTARYPRFKAVLGFAPLTHPKPLEELKSFDAISFEKLSLMALAERLVHTPLRFYIGNRDTRVGTDACYQFIHVLTEKAFEIGKRSPAVELRIYPSVGHKGHGTPPEIFMEGADWMYTQIT